MKDTSLARLKTGGVWRSRMTTPAFSECVSAESKRLDLACMDVAIKRQQTLNVTLATQRDDVHNAVLQAAHLCTLFLARTCWANVVRACGRQSENEESKREDN
eukprot:3856383-Amphidinium_carterae.1